MERKDSDLVGVSVCRLQLRYPPLTSPASFECGEKRPAKEEDILFSKDAKGPLEGEREGVALTVDIVSSLNEAKASQIQSVANRYDSKDTVDAN